MSPETAALISGIAVAAITAGPAYLSARRAASAASDEGALTREALEAAADVQGARLDALAGELRADVREVRADLADVRAWTAGHTAEHVLLRTTRDSRDSE